MSAEEDVRLKPGFWPPRWWVWVFVAPAVFIPLLQLWLGPGERVDVLGAGPLHVVLDGPPPDGVRFEGSVFPQAPLEDTDRRIREGLLELPRVVVIGSAAPTTAEEAQRLPGLFDAWVTRAHRSSVVSVIVAPELPTGPAQRRAAIMAFRARLRVRCRTLERALCVDLDGESPARARAKLHHAAQRAVARLHALQATTRSR
ncbi:MAG: hypothetical protein AAFZ18_03350 [Myxococcota bacterium]